MDNDIYKTIASPSEPILLKEKNSKFLGYAFPIDNEEEVKEIIDDLRKQNNGAGHFCYAYQMGVDKISYRANDDGEPSGTAGKQIFGVIESHNLSNVGIVVVRYYGGTKLGVPGLISAYKTSAVLSVEMNEIILEIQVLKLGKLLVIYLEL